METIHDLDKILISPRVYQSWFTSLPLFMQDILIEVEDITFNPKKDIPDEQFRELPDGTGEIFLNIEKISKEIKMKVPKEEWTFR